MRSAVIQRAALVILCCAIAACGGGSIDPCARLHAREQIPEQHCPAPTDPSATAATHTAAPNTAHTTAQTTANLTETERPNP
jgi:hypothetical protein